MPPKITNPDTWQQAEVLMQPAFIRIIDHLRRQLETSTWKGTYQDVLIWPSDTTDATKTIVTQLLQELATAPEETAMEIKQTLMKLPKPHPGYHLCLQRQEQQVSVDLWELCYQVCFRNYSSLGDEAVEIDTSLMEDDTVDVDWQRLDGKVGELVAQVFANLPSD
jgi:hypothetical protein